MKKIFCVLALASVIALASACSCGAPKADAEGADTTEVVDTVDSLATPVDTAVVE